MRAAASGSPALPPAAVSRGIPPVPNPLDDDDLKAGVVAAIGLRGVADAAENVDPVVTRANRWAYQLVKTVLAGRGFSPAQIDAVQDLTELVEQIGLDFALAMLVKADDEGAETVADVRKRWREELESVVVAAADERVDAAGSGDVGFGSYDTSEDRHTMDDVL